MMATTLRDYLTRFRRLAAPPGRAAPAGVPVDRVAELSAEVAAVFAAVDEAQASVEHLERQAETEADRILRAARTEAERIGAEARERAAVARVEAAAARQRIHADEIQAGLSRAEADAERIQRRADERLPGLVRTVVEIVGSGGSPPAPGGRA